MIINVAKVFLPSIVAFGIGIFLAPILTHFLYIHKAWKKRAGKIATDGRATPIFNELHKHKEVGTPKMGGVLIWVSIFLTIALFRLLSEVSTSLLAEKLNFLSRGQTWVPLFTLAIGAGIGFLDDFLEVTETGGYFAGGLSLSKRLAVVAITGIGGGVWFFSRLDVSSVLLPFGGELELGILFIPLFTSVMLALYSGGVIDGIDGLAGGIFAIIFSAYGGIAFFQNQIDLAAFCAVVVGATLSFLWFNIPPARFYMSETGTMALTMALAVVAFLTKAVFVLPIIAFPLLATGASDIIQLASKKFRNGKKVFLVAPIHHHFEALGWPGYKVTMRYWIITIILAIIGMVVALI